ncbi:Predicted membrane protein [Mycolicibacterium rutilum]|uniref:Predicted membrane protein n=2 Tax=Mycolicibacterium rutilum TaxID=370526 RepID=A0A1H6M6Z7_MYCRU|nr:Predicted membrane protein [Mycolicibacterium rutilum]
MRWAAALAVVVGGFLAYSLPPYLTGGTRVPATFAWHYPLLVGHVALGSIATVAAVVQIWPGLRARHRVLHRRSGRVYVVTAVPAALSAVVIGALTPFGPLLAVSNVVLAVLWLWFTVAGYRAIRSGRVSDHRRHMVRSATLALSIITNRIWAPVLFMMCYPLRDSIFGGNEEHYLWFVAGLGGWLGWLVPLTAVQWWLNRRPVNCIVVNSSARGDETGVDCGPRSGQRRRASGRGRYGNRIQRQDRTGHP